ncbi:Abortive infection protein [Alkaliphilus metalliredigens QYMF]|uniref:Abortive infection protein n=1 Tax=Alkaliphilus metalliredigens (strain QYMF) TaxID=293826 RepID=A6TM35_ALKMQ|nr:CPBP family intramembrane glutamic endopeptidase [Alkaliphilus metalliredigens]ABR47253.1 Abortive infection protein [Alkaliphilus metalliredigens QYMF]
MKTYIKTTWQITKYILIHFVIIMLYNFGAGAFYGVKMAMNDQLDEIESGIEAFLAPHTSISIIIAAIGAFLIYRYIMKRKNLNLYEECRFKKLSRGQTLASLSTGVSILSLSLLILGMTSFMFQESLDTHINNTHSLISVHPLLLIISVGIAAPFIEEILFRGLVFRELEQKSTIAITIIIQAIIFGAYHLNLAHGIMTTIMGIFLGLSLYWTGSIWAPILIHLTNNLLSVVLDLLGYGIFIETYPLADKAICGTAVLIVLPLSILYLYRSRITWEPKKVDEKTEIEKI